MAPHVSPALRERIVYWREVDGKQINEIADLAGCSERTVYTVLQLHRDFGTFNNPYARPRGRPRQLSTADTTYLSSLLQANPTLYLDEIQDQLLATRDVEVSISTISRALRHLAVTHKTVSKSSAERNEELRAIWQAEYGGIPMDSFVWLDESSVDDLTNHRTEGWSALGRACVRRATFLRGQRFSVLPALSVDGIIACDIFEGSVNKERFIKFIAEDLVCSDSRLLLDIG